MSNSEKLLLKGIRIGIVAALFSPLILGQFGLDFAEYPKAVFFRSLTEIIFIAYLILVLKGGAEYLPKIKNRFQIFAVLFFCGSLVLSTFTSIDPHLSFWGTIVRPGGVVTYLHFLAFFWVLISTVKEKEDWLQILNLTVLISGIPSLAGILQKLGLASFYGTDLPERISGTFSNPDLFGSYLVLNIFLGLFLLTIENGKKRAGGKAALIAITVLNFFTLFLSGQRGAWVGAAAGLIFFEFFWLLRYSRPHRRLKIIVLSLTLAFGIIAALLVINREKLTEFGSPPIQRAASILNIKDVLSTRLILWDIAFQGWKEKPILGWGPETFYFVFDKHLNADYLRDLPEGIAYDRAHNTVLDLAATSGVFGVVSYFFIFLSTFYLLFKHKSNWGPIPSLALSALFVAYFVQNLAIFDSISSYLIFFLLLGFTNSTFVNDKIATERSEDSTFVEEADPKESTRKISVPYLESLLKVMAFLLILISATLFYTLNLKPLKVNLDFIQAASLEKKDFPKALNKYKEVNQQTTVFNSNFKLALVQKLLNAGRHASLDKEMAEIFSDLAGYLEGESEKPAVRYLRLHEFLVKLYGALYAISQDAKFLENMERVSWEMVSFNGEYPPDYALLGETRILQKKSREGVALFQKAFELRGGQDEDLLLYYQELGTAYLRAGDLPQAAKTFEEIINFLYSAAESGNPLAARLASAQTPYIRAAAEIYWKNLSDPQSAVEIYKKALLVYPNDREILQENIKKLKKRF
ncbi:hypothetical protein A2V54_02200 [candidate division WWE3 bacterium RBG_19FT_COMBO_53_11]|uniref:O-antigen ligase-related domain-containing protein n=1 Tax=candidate division WWE3 bacterium RBG_19FT_COMBO_53_11 TaxID=1802613 RepID=A0A1F4UIX8_UNCKA|nr:MAG: hypothetical protein A2155_01750 [candidate division WWE3 bacterium RBG_16_52_45]OGC44812.1 MAG: hypothetical protein A2V54_02200 [candidate division WWE3 bacterium RBG_19FT_COMBO_53_11]